MASASETVEAVEGVTHRVARFVASLDQSAVPAEVMSHAKECLLDTLGCGIFGSTLSWTAILRDTLCEIDNAEVSNVWGTPVRLGAPHAALVNGAAVHGFELDDLHKESILHPGSTVIPAVFAAADVVGGVDGLSLLTAIVAGYEVGARVGMSVGTAHLLQGWHPTGTHGAVAAAAGAASVFGLATDETQHAIGIAGSLASGLMASQFASMVKRFHAGRAAQSGLYAALLARRGYTGITELFESEYGGYCSSFSPTYDLSVLDGGLGVEWETLRVGFKPYSTNGSCHTIIDALRELRAERGFDLQAVVQVDIRVSTATAAHVGWPYEPSSVTTAQMNLPFITSLVLSEGDAFVDQFDDDHIFNPDLIALSRKVAVVADPEIDRRGPSYRHACRVDITLSDGTTLVGEREHALGSSRYPLTRQALHEKYRRLAGRAMPEDSVKAVEYLVEHMDQLASSNEISAALVKERQ